MRGRSRILGYGSAALLVVVGIVLGIAIGGTFGQVLAMTLIGIGLVLAIGLVFLEVGLSEDRERAREAVRREAARQSAAKQGAPEPRRRRGLERMRGSRRRLK